MKKITLILLAAVAMTFVACGNRGGKNAETTYQTYTNEKYGFTVEVPSTMTQRGESMGDEGTVFSLESKKDEITFNRIDISGDNNWEGDYKIEDVIEKLKDWHDFSEFTNMKQGDNYFTYTIPGEYVTQIDYYVINGPTKVSMSVCYEPGFEKQLGGEVAEHVFKSVKFN
jgi:hypothetical protein